MSDDADSESTADCSSPPASHTDDGDPQTTVRPTRRRVLGLAPAIAAALGGCSWGASGGGNPDGTSSTGPPSTGTTPPGTPTRGSSPSGNADGRTTTGSTPDPPTDQPTSTDRPTTTLEPPLDEFDRVIDAVEDAGCDPTGVTPCGPAIERVVADGVALRFPAGRYRFERGYGFRGLDHLGFVGEGRVTFVPPPGFNDKLIELSGDRMVFKGIDVDLRARDTTAGIRVITNDGFQIEDVTFRGRGTHPDEAVTNALAVAVENAGGKGTVRNVVAEQGSAIGHYKNGNGRVGIWVGRRHNGSVTVEDCRLAEFGNNGIYASRALGSTQVIGGTFRNNNIAGVRLGAPGSSVTGATVEIDVDGYTGPRTRTDDAYNTRAVVVEQGPHDESGRVVVEDCSIRLHSADRSQGGLVVWPTGNGPRIESCQFTTTVDEVAAITALPPVRRVAARDRPLEIRDSAIDGAAIGGEAISLQNRPFSTVADVEVVQSGADRDGIELVSADPLQLTGTAVRVTRFPLVALNPRGGGDRCLARVGPRSTLQRSTPAPPGTSTQARSSGGGSDCIGDGTFAGLDASEVIAITDVDEETVSWFHHTPTEDEGDSA